MVQVKGAGLFSVCIPGYLAFDPVVTVAVAVVKGPNAGRGNGTHGKNDVDLPVEGDDGRKLHYVR